MAASTYSDIREALHRRLTAYRKTNVSFENGGYEEKPDTPYISAWVVFNQPSQATLGQGGGQNRIQGYLVLDVRHPIGTGWKNPSNEADALVEHFKRGTSLTYNGQTVRISSAWPGPAIPEGGWYRVPVMVEFFDHADN